MNINRLKYFAFQILPPLLLLLIVNSYGPTFSFLMGIALLASAISILSLIIMLFRLKEKKPYMLRPALTILITAVLLPILTGAMNEAREQALLLAGKIQDECKINQKCPANLSKWERDSADRPYRHMVGNRIVFPVYYTTDENRKTFTLVMIKVSGIGIALKGGVEVQLKEEYFVD
ncbi:MAG: hypothetical protein OEZ10_01085 [Gammaproteobacteria bacterium]|nr:hypothetical protein [Gammaproteobacteria bacterium]